MNNNELIIVSFCELTQSEMEGINIIPFLDFQFNTDTKGIVLIRTKKILKNNAYVNIILNDDIIWTSKVIRAPKNINYSETDNLVGYISERIVISKDISNGINNYYVELIEDDNVLGGAVFQASVEHESELNSKSIETEKDSNYGSQIKQEEYENTIDYEDKMTQVEENDNKSDALNDNCRTMQEYKEQTCCSNSEQVDVFAFETIIKYKDEIKTELDKLINDTMIIQKENYLNVVASDELSDTVVNIRKTKKNIEEKFNIVMNFYKNAFNSVENSIENEKLEIAKRLLENNIDPSVVAEIVKIDLEKIL